MAYAMKSPIERTPENAAYVSNRNAERRAMEEARIEEAWEQAAQKAKAEEKQSASPIQYSLAENEKSVLDKQDLARFYAAIGEMKAGKRAQFQKNADGLYMLAIGNKIVYTDGKWASPSIEKVDVIHKEHETEIEPIRDAIFYVEQMGGLDANEMRRALSKVLEDGDFERYGDGISASDNGDGIARGEGDIGNEVYSGAGSDGKPQYSVRFDEDKRLNALINYARDNVQPELLEMALGKKLNALFEKQNTRTSFQQANPVRIAKELAANLGTKIYTADINNNMERTAPEALRKE